jgi:hypothetical protein
MRIEEEAFKGLWPEKGASYDFSVKYSGKFKGYNANVKMQAGSITFSLSRKWRDISRDIKIGLLQELLAKLFRERKTTQNIELYHIFMKKVHIAVPKTQTEPELEESFTRVNERFFAGMVEQPNLKWSSSTTKLGSYDYGSDTVTISLMLRDADIDSLDYVMYHEILHKKHKFTSGGGTLRYHTREFRESERQYPNSSEIEKRLRTLSSRKVAAKRAKNRNKGILRFFLPLF